MGGEVVLPGGGGERGRVAHPPLKQAGKPRPGGEGTAGVSVLGLGILLSLLPAPDHLVHRPGSWSFMLEATVMSEMGVSLVHAPPP